MGIRARQIIADGLTAEEGKHVRFKSLVVSAPPYIGLLSSQFLSSEPSERVDRITDEMQVDIDAMIKALSSDQVRDNWRLGPWRSSATGEPCRRSLSHAQVNTVPWAFFVTMGDYGLPAVVANPDIVQVERRRNRWERSLSRNGLKENKVRYERIRVSYWEPNNDGELANTIKWLEGDAAQVFQHQYEYVVGRLIT